MHVRVPGRSGKKICRQESKLVACFRPFPEHLVASGLYRTITKKTCTTSGPPGAVEIIRDPNEDPYQIARNPGHKRRCLANRRKGHFVERQVATTSNGRCSPDRCRTR